ncbi:MAG: FIST C-terminal domain-containing protein [Candidatus Cloacimonetes bacterium]|nr:FIST C-terminal domain-containing protein [Candidatus Cloacimonadota bacterium]
MSQNISIGLSVLKDSFVAGVQAVRQARAVVGSPLLTIVFGSIHHDQEELLKGVCSQVDKNTVIGVSSYAEISNAGVSYGSVVVLLLGLEDCQVYKAHSQLGSSENQLGLDLASQIPKHLNNAEELIQLGLFFRGIGSGYKSYSLKAMEGYLKKVSLMGGLSCGDYDLGMSHPDFWTSYQYFGQEVEDSGASLSILALPKSKFKVSFGFDHGWTPVGPEMIITKADKEKVYEVDGMPVLDFYRQFLGDKCSEDFFELMIQRFGFSIEREFDGNVKSLIRIPVGVDHQERHIKFFPPEDFQGKKVRLIQASRRGVIEGARNAAQRCLQGLNGRKPHLLLAISCCTRAAILHSRTASEVQVIQEVFGEDVPLIGYYSGGEIFPFLSKYDDVIQEEGEIGGSQYHATTIGVMALFVEDGNVKVDYPQNAILQLGDSLELNRIRDLLKGSEDILDDTESFLSELSQKTYNVSELLKVQNEELSLSNRENLHLQDIVHRYTPHEVWKKAGESVARGDYELPEADVCRVFMFMDVKGFTSFSEENSSKVVVEKLNEIFYPATEIIYACDGDVDKYIGDCIFAVFTNASQAVEAATQIIEMFQVLKQKGNPFSVRIGLNSGRAIHGNVGAKTRREYTYIGDAVNIAQRLESSCIPGEVLMSKEIFENCDHKFNSHQEVLIPLKGKKDKILAVQCKL